MKILYIATMLAAIPIIFFFGVVLVILPIAAPTDNLLINLFLFFGGLGLLKIGTEQIYKNTIGD